MEEIEARVLRAQAAPAALEGLVRDYLPFVRAQLAGKGTLGLEYDDMESLALLTFVGCVRQYAPGRGGFLGFCKVSIHNRLIDEARKQGGYRAKVVPLFPAPEGGTSPDEEASLAAYDRAREAQGLREEIESLSCALAPFGVSFAELPRICPKQGRSRRQCLALARVVAGDQAHRAQLLGAHRLPQGTLAKRFGLSAKTVEKHRKYIVTLAVLLCGDYPAIRAFLPRYEEVEP